jgi:hypothetical protein
MVQAARPQRMGERAHDVLLANQRVEVLGAVFACEDLIGHTAILPQLKLGANFPG